MRFVKKKSSVGVFEIVVTSLLDINFLLIMFFMMTAQFQRETRAALNLPREQGEQEPKPDESGIVVNVSASGEIVVSNRTVTLEDLLEMVQEAKVLGTDDGQPMKLLVRADKDASTADLNRVVQGLRTAGVGVIRIATISPR